MTEQMLQALEKAAVKDTGKTKDYPISTQDAALHGANLFLENLWHQVDVPPEPGKDLIVKSQKGMKIYPNPANTKMSWDFFVRISRAISWAYSEDILPNTETINNG